MSSLLWHMCLCFLLISFPRALIPHLWDSQERKQRCSLDDPWWSLPTQSILWFSLLPAVNERLYQKALSSCLLGDTGVLPVTLNCFFVQQSSRIWHSLKCMFIALWVFVYNWSVQPKGGQEKLPSPLLMFHGAQTIWEQICEAGFLTSGRVDIWLPTSSWYSHRWHHYFYIRELKSLSCCKGKIWQLALPFSLEAVTCCRHDVTSKSAMGTGLHGKPLVGIRHHFLPRAPNVSKFLANGDTQILYGQSAKGFQLWLPVMEPIDYEFCGLCILPASGAN